MDSGWFLHLHKRKNKFLCCGIFKPVAREFEEIRINPIAAHLKNASLKKTRSHSLYVEALDHLKTEVESAAL